MTTELAVSAITVSDRHRKDMGDLRGLADSIDTLGLIQPVVVDSQNRLVAGERRLRACELLGWDSVPVSVIHSLGDARDRLEAERDENTCRKAMSASELAVLGEALEALERPKAQQRQSDAGKSYGRGKEDSLPSHDGKLLTSANDGPSKYERSTDHIVGEALGISGAQYSRLKDLHKTATGQKNEPPEVVDTAKQQLNLVDKGETTIFGAKAKINEAREKTKTHKGRGNEKKQIKTLENTTHMFRGALDALEHTFTGGFEKTCTPTIAADYAKQLNTELTRFTKIVKLLDNHGKEK